MLLAAGLALPAFAAPLAGNGRYADTHGVGMSQMKLESVEAGGEIQLPAVKRNLFTINPDDGIIRFESPVQERRQRAAMSATAASRAMDANIPLFGQMTYHDAWTAENFSRFMGFYAIPHSSDELFVLKGLTGNDMTWGGYYDPENHVYYGICSDLSLQGGSATYCYSLGYNTQTWERVRAEVLPTIKMCAFSVARDPIDGKVYGYYINDTGDATIWAEADYSLGIRDRIADVPFSQRMILLAADENGQFYGINQSGQLCKINKATGHAEVIATTNLPIHYQGGCAINNRNHTMLATSFTLDGRGSGLYEIDLTTGNATLVSQFFGDIQMMNLFINNEVDEKAPMAPALEVTAPEGAMTARVDITLPETLFDGTPIEGTVDWKVLVDGELKFEGRNQKGTTIGNTVTLETVGYHNFVAYASNASGESEHVIKRVFIGNGIPSVPTNIRLNWDAASSMMKVTWLEVSKSADGGYVRKEDIVYTIYKDGAKVGEVKGAGSWEEQIEVPLKRTAYQYGITATFDGQSCPMQTTNTVYLGAYDAPFELDITKLGYDQIRKDYGFTYIDANNDNNKWDQGSAGLGYKSRLRSQGADDWAVSPEIWLEAGKTYGFTGRVHTQSATSVSKGQLVSIHAGQGAEPAALTTEIVPPTTVLCYKADAMPLTGFFTPTVTGPHHFAIHISTPGGDSNYDPTNQFRLLDFNISQGMNPAAPAGLTNITATPDASGLLKNVIKFTVPSTNFIGEALTGQVTVTIVRNGEAIKTLRVTKGSNQTFTDQVPERGTYTYELTPSQNDAVGATSSFSTFVGPYAPRAVDRNSIKMYEVFQPGTVMLTWDAPTKDTHNPAQDLSQSNVSYMVYSLPVFGTGRQPVPVLAENVKKPMATFEATDDYDVQKFVTFCVAAFNRDAQSDLSEMPVKPLGKAYDLPVKYSSNADLQKFIACNQTLGNSSWGYFGDGGDLSSQDGDDGFFATSSKALQSYCRLHLGKIDLTSSENPELTFYLYKFNDEPDQNYVAVRIVVDGEEKTLGYACNDPEAVNLPEQFVKNDPSSVVAGKWNKMRFDLSAYKNKVVQFIFEANHNTHMNTAVDNIRVQETADKDLVAMSITAPEKVAADEKFPVSVRLTSWGIAPTGSFTVDLFRDGELLESRKVDNLGYQEEMQVDFEDVITLFDENSANASYAAEIVLDGDVDPSNNLTDEVTVARVKSELPVVADLRGELLTEGTRLEWTGYTSADAKPMQMTEDFEDAESWAEAVNGWIIYDGDNDALLSSIGGFKIPYARGNKAGFFVFDATHPNMNSVSATNQPKLTAHSGNKYLASVSIPAEDEDTYTTADWAISPVLSSEQPQTVTFWARSYSGSEYLKVYYTNDDIAEGQEVKDYVKAIDVAANQIKVINGKSASYLSVNGTWTLYSFEVPAGAARFAIRSYSNDRYMLEIDDISFIPDPTYNAPALAGYDIYRDGVKLNDAPVNATEYIDTDMPVGSHTYHVVGVFNKGRSELSNPVSLERSGLDLVLTGGPSVSVEGNDIVVSGAQGCKVAIVAVDGKALLNRSGNVRLAVAKGVYLVTVDRKTVKVIVK